MLYNPGMRPSAPWMEETACTNFIFSMLDIEKSKTKKHSNNDIMSEKVHIHSGAPPPPPSSSFRSTIESLPYGLPSSINIRGVLGFFSSGFWKNVPSPSSV